MSNGVFPEQLGVGAADVVGIDGGGVERAAACKVMPGDASNGGGESPGWSRHSGSQFEADVSGQDQLALFSRKRSKPVLKLHDGLGGHGIELRVIETAINLTAPRIERDGSKG